MNKSKARKHGFFIIQTDDGDRYYREVYKKGEMEHIASHSEEANELLEERWLKYCEENNLDPLSDEDESRHL